MRLFIMVRFIFCIVALGLLSISCSRPLPSITDPSKRLTIVSGVSVLPPQEPEWKILKMAKSDLMLAKQGKHHGESYAIRVVLDNLPNLDTDQDFVKLVTASRASDDDRYKTIKLEDNLVHGRKDVCVHYHGLYEDKAANIGTDIKAMILETVGYNCRHPKNKRIGVSMEYSYRYFAGNNDPAMMAKSSSFFDQVQFTDF